MTRPEKTREARAMGHPVVQHALNHPSDTTAALVAADKLEELGHPLAIVFRSYRRAARWVIAPDPASVIDRAYDHPAALMLADNKNYLAIIYRSDKLARYVWEAYSGPGPIATCLATAETCSEMAAKLAASEALARWLRGEISRNRQKPPSNHICSRCASLYANMEIGLGEYHLCPLCWSVEEETIRAGGVSFKTSVYIGKPVYIRPEEAGTSSTDASPSTGGPP